MARIQSGLRRVQSLKRKTTWEEGVGGDDQTTVAASISTFLGAALAVTEDGLTLVRTRGSFQIYLRTIAAVSDGFHCALGIGIANVNAITVGITAVQTPITNMDWDGWLYHRFFDIHAAAGAIDTTEPQASIQFEVDSKAMRKINQGDALYCVLETVERGTATATAFFDSRMLFKIP